MIFPSYSLLAQGPVRQLLLANFMASIATGISSILIPWILVKEFSSTHFSMLASATTFVLIFLMPVVGRMVDQFRRKRILLFTSVAGALFFLTLSLMERGNAAYSVTLLVAFSLTQVYYNVFFPARGALAQSLTEKKNFGRLNGWLEIENQTAAFSAGTLAVLLLDLVPISTIFQVCVGSLICAAFAFETLPEKARPVSHAEDTPQRKKTPVFDRSLVLLALAGNIPFVCVMVLNVVKPIFIFDVLLASAEVLAVVSVCYTVGAVASGVISSWLMNRMGCHASLILAISGFVLSTSVLMAVDSIGVLYASSICWGVFNSLARISTQTIVMGQVHNDVMGRFSAHIQRLTMFARTAAILGFTGMFLAVDYSYSFWYVTAVALVGPLLLLARRRVPTVADAGGH